MAEANVKKLEADIDFLKEEIKAKNEIIKIICTTEAREPANPIKACDKNGYNGNFEKHGEHDGFGNNDPYTFPKKSRKANLHDTNSFIKLKNQFGILDNTGIKNSPLFEDEKSTDGESVKDENVTSSIRKRKSYRSTAILGDSTIKDIKAFKLRKNIPKGNKIYVKPFSGATTDCMGHHVKPSMKFKNDLYILHTGTNDLRSSKSATDIAEDIVSLACEMKTKDNDVVISGITGRKDEWDRKGIEVNKHLNQICINKNILFLDNRNISRDMHLNGSGLHLNANGVNQLANNFLNTINL